MHCFPGACLWCKCFAEACRQSSCWQVSLALLQELIHDWITGVAAWALGCWTRASRGKAILRRCSALRADQISFSTSIAAMDSVPPACYNTIWHTFLSVAELAKPRATSLLRMADGRLP